MALWLTNPTNIYEDAGLIPALLSGLRVQCYPALWCRLQTWLRSHVAVAVVWASSYSSDSTPSLGTSMFCEYGPKREKKSQWSKVPGWEVRHRTRDSSHKRGEPRS